MIGGRPYEDTAELLGIASALAGLWVAADVGHALADHPRIGESPTGGTASAGHARTEQGGVDPGDPAVLQRLREGNARYEQKFGRIYLVRAKGRSGHELAVLLERRLLNHPETELEVTRSELQSIALLRLAELVS